MADLLEQGRALHLLSVGLSAGAVAALLLGPGGWSAAGPAAVLLAGLAETWLALRVGFDARCFRRIARGADDPGLACLDAALLRLGLMPGDKAGRPMASRLEGARRLLGLQGAALVAQAGPGLLAVLTT